MRPNPKQRKVLMVCASVVLAMLLYPPVRFRDFGRGFRWIFAMDDGLTVNASQLLVQWVGVAIIGFVAYVLFEGNGSGAGSDAKPGDRSHLARRFGADVLLPLLRLARALVAAVGFWQGLGIASSMAMSAAMILERGVDASQELASYLAQVSLKAVIVAACIWAAGALRSLINALHVRWLGSPHMELVSRWRL